MNVNEDDVFANAESEQSSPSFSFKRRFKPTITFSSLRTRTPTIPVFPTNVIFVDLVVSTCDTLKAIVVSIKEKMPLGKDSDQSDSNSNSTSTSIVESASESVHYIITYGISMERCLKEKLDFRTKFRNMNDIRIRRTISIKQNLSIQKWRNELQLKIPYVYIYRTKIRGSGSQKDIDRSEWAIAHEGSNSIDNTNTPCSEDYLKGLGFVSGMQEEKCSSLAASSFSSPPASSSSSSSYSSENKDEFSSLLEAYFAYTDDEL